MYGILIIKIIITLFILLWSYSTLSKLTSISRLRNTMLLQVFPKWVKHLLVWILPVYEGALAFLLIFEKTQLLGMYLSFFTLLLFSLYIEGAMLNIYGRRPCACRGLFRKMDWKNHLKFNIICTSISFMGLLLLEFGN